MDREEMFWRSRPHPWHGLRVGADPPRQVDAFIEITPFDVLKYEVDRETGYLRVDRPQLTSSLPPNVYGFIPRTFCAERVNELSPKARRGDGDPLDICVVSERPIGRAEIVLSACVIGGFQVIDNDEADDKIIGVLRNDTTWSRVRDVSELPANMVERMRHYFSTYKLVPGQVSRLSVEELYGRDHALRVVEAAMEDYNQRYGHRQE